MWIKCRAKWSHGFSEWEYSYYGGSSFEEAVDLKKEEAENDYSWSEHYRGVEIELVPIPPAKVVKAEINEVKRFISFYEKKLKELSKFSTEELV